MKLFNITIRYEGRGETLATYVSQYYNIKANSLSEAYEEALDRSNHDLDIINMTVFCEEQKNWISVSDALQRKLDKINS